MNLIQRIVLILGAVALIIVIWTTPKMIYTQGQYYDMDKYMERLEGYSRLEQDLAPTIDYKIASMKVIAVVGSTLFVFFAFKGIGKKEGS